ncbi:MAG: LysM peptidoglycan-binding domain-containing protein [Deltaproteobacteria bacterium]|nr:LysM peptidoglycan-binding domain-containing protein [Deltaproteobacteria bacterium]
MTADNHAPQPRFHLYKWCAILITALTLAVGSPAFARKVRQEHVVKPGESIARIADHYGVSQRDLRELNKWPKGKPLNVGQTLKIPNVLRLAGKTYKVKEGDSLASIGQKFDRTPSEIAHANKLKVDDALSVGRVLVIPDKGTGSAGTVYKTEDGPPGETLFLRVRTGERERLQLYSKSGKINKTAVMQLSHLARDHKTQKVKRLNTRLIYLLQKISDNFDSHTIEIISGYREQSIEGNESQHAFGRAMDIRIPGASGKSVYNFCLKLPRTGCGYYPKDGFVHVDAREKKTYWTGK